MWSLGSSKKHWSVHECTEVCWAVEKLMPSWRRRCFQYLLPVSHVMHFQVGQFGQVCFQSNQWFSFSLLFRGISRHLGYTKWRALKGSPCYLTWVACLNIFYAGNTNKRIHKCFGSLSLSQQKISKTHSAQNFEQVSRNFYFTWEKDNIGGF